jgi:hypothetical protein
MRLTSRRISTTDLLVIGALAVVVAVAVWSALR